MRKYLAFYENEWPANIAELTAIENKPFVGYLKDQGLMFTVIPKPVTGPADNEIWYTSSDGNVVTPRESATFGGVNIVSNTYLNDRGIITFDGDVSSISPMAFNNCKYLTSVTIPESVIQIQSYAFSGCSSLTSVTIPENVTSIGRNAFSGCSSLTSVTIPNSVTSIGYEAFACASLDSIIFNGTMEEFYKIERATGWISIYTPATHVQCSDGQVTL